MATAGRRPLPTNLKILKGNPGHRALNEAEPKPRATCPDPPPWMTLRAQDCWRHYAGVLAASKVLTEADLAMLEGFCVVYGRWREAESRVTNPSAWVIKSPSGYPTQNPYLGIANKALKELRALASELGLSPSSRSRVQTVKGSGDEGDMWADFALN